MLAENTYRLSSTRGATGTLTGRDDPGWVTDFEDPGWQCSVIKAIGAEPSGLVGPMLHTASYRPAQPLYTQSRLSRAGDLTSVWS
jgi:hypothetical protein